MVTEQDLNELRAEVLRASAKADLAREDANRAKEDANRAKEDADRARLLTEQSEAKMHRTLESMGIRLGSMGQNQGDVAEEFFYNSLEDAPTVGGIHYDFKDKNWRKRVGQIQDEFDIVLVNAEHIALIEVKYKAHENDLKRLLDKKISHFKILFPEYAHYQHHLALASLHMNDDLKQSALDAGVMVLQRKGDVIESFLPNP